MRKFFVALLMFMCLPFAFAQKVLNVGDFSSIKAYDRIKVELIKSSDNKVEIFGEDASEVLVVNKNGELKVKMSTVKFLQGNTTKVKVYYNRLNDIHASQGAVITNNDELKANLLTITSNQGSVIKLHLNVETLKAKLNSGGVMELHGKANSQSIVLNTGGEFSGKELKGKNVDIALNAGGDADVYASDSIVANTKAGGMITIYGQPKDKKTKTLFGGKIEFK